MHKNYKLVITGSNGSYTNMHCDHILENANMLHIDKYAIKDSLSVKFNDSLDIDALKEALKAVGTVTKVELLNKVWIEDIHSSVYRTIFESTAYDTFILLSRIAVWDTESTHKYVLSIGKSSDLEDSSAEELKHKYYFAYQADI